MFDMDWASFAMGFLVCAAIMTLVIALATRLLRWMLGSRWLTALLGALVGYRIPPVESNNEGIMERISGAIRRRQW